MSELDLERRMRRVLAEMSTISEVPANSQGSKIRGGTPDRSPKGPNEGLADEFARRWNGARTETGRQAVFDAAVEALEHARRMSIPAGQPPMPGDPLWKRWVAESKLDGGELARLFNVKRQYIHQIRVQYRKDA